MEKNNKGRFLICIIALAISFLAIIISIIAFWSSCKMEYDSGNALMSAVSIIVTILIGAVTVLIAWQVYNHYVAKDEVRKMVEEETKKLAEDTWNVLDSIISSSNLISFSQGDHKDFDAYRNKSVGFIFQNYNLISHINLLDNVAMGLTLSGKSIPKISPS